MLNGALGVAIVKTIWLTVILEYLPVFKIKIYILYFMSIYIYISLI